jgi:hypothetical protein
MSDLNRRLKKAEKKLRPAKESEAIPLVIVTQHDPNDRAKGAVIIGGDPEKQGNEQEAITTA